jgi:hypothetical protein
VCIGTEIHWFHVIFRLALVPKEAMIFFCSVSDEFGKTQEEKGVKITIGTQIQDFPPRGKSGEGDKQEKRSERVGNYHKNDVKGRDTDIET